MNQQPMESPHPTLNTAPFFREVQFILGGENPRYLPDIIQRHVSPDISACSCLWKMNSVSFESRFNGEYDAPSLE